MKKVKNGKIIHGYAASTKGNTILQFFEIDANILTAISDRNPDKWGNLRLAQHSNYLRKGIQDKVTRLLFCFSLAFY